MTLLFMIGSGRCGATMIWEVLTRHPKVGFISNLDDKLSILNLKGRWNNLLYRHTPIGLARRDRIILQLLQRRLVHYGPSEAWQLLARHVSPMVTVPFRDLTDEDVTPWVEDRLRRFFNQRMLAQKKQVFIHKFTGWPRAQFLHRIFPDAKFLHVVRDGRAVASSLTQMSWWRGYLGPPGWRFGELPEPYEREWEQSGRSFLALAGIEWKCLMDAFEVAKRHIPPNGWMEVRYEDVLEQPRAKIGEILDFLGLDWTATFERDFRKYSFSKSQKDAYRRELTPSQFRLLNEIIGDYPLRFGYTNSEKDSSALPGAEGTTKF